MKNKMPKSFWIFVAAFYGSMIMLFLVFILLGVIL